MKKHQVNAFNFIIFSLSFAFLSTFPSDSVAETMKESLKSCVNSLKTQQYINFELQDEYISLLDQKLIEKTKKPKKAKA